MINGEEEGVWGREEEAKEGKAGMMWDLRL